jgi:hypothetical protein
MSHATAHVRVRPASRRGEEQRSPSAPRRSVKPFLFALLAATALAVGGLTIPAGDQPTPEVVKIAPGAGAARVALDRAERARHDRSRTPRTP